MAEKKDESRFAGLLRKAADTAKSAQEKAQSMVQDVKLPKIDASEIKASVKEGWRKVTEKAEKKDDPSEPAAPVARRSISTESALRIFYYLMAADGKVYHDEEEKYDAIGREIDPDFAASKDGIVARCTKQLEKVIDPEDYYEVLQDGVEDAILDSRETADTFITPKLLLWDMLAIAYSDESYDDPERKLIKYTVRKLGIDKAVFLEMESSMLTLLGIEREIAWIKTTDRPYLTIEARVNELTKRKTVVFDSVKDLITL